VTARGALYRGQIIPGSDFILRDPSAWFAPETDPDDVEPRAASEVQTQATAHWTGGHCITGPRTARRVIHSMRARLRENGEPMSVSIGFVAGWDGQIWQTADLSMRTIHAGRRFNRAGPGIECTWPGTAKQGKTLGYEFARERRRGCRGRAVWCMPPSPELLAGVREWWAWLSRVSLPGLEIRTLREHMHAPGTTKNDAAGYVIDACAGA
jgi:hypothetical protein